MNLTTIILQAAAGSSLGDNLLVTSIIAIAFFILVFFLVRSILLWYWKVDVIVKNQETQTDLLQRQNTLIQEQTNLLKALKDQMGNSHSDPNAEALRS